MCQYDSNLLKWPAFAVGVHAKRHVGACSQCGQQQLVRIRTCITAARLLRLVCEQLMGPYRNGLAQPKSATTHYYVSRHFVSPSHWAVHRITNGIAYNAED